MTDSDLNFSRIDELLASTVTGEVESTPTVTLLSMVSPIQRVEPIATRGLRKIFSQKSVIEDLPKELADFMLRTKPFESENNEISMELFFDYMDGVFPEVDFLETYSNYHPQEVYDFVALVTWLNRQFVANEFITQNKSFSEDFMTLYTAAKRRDLFKYDKEQRKRAEDTNLTRLTNFTKVSTTPSTIIRTKSKQMVLIEKKANECISCLAKLMLFLEAEGELEACHLVLEETQKFEETMFRRRRVQYVKVYYDKAMLYLKQDKILDGEKMFKLAQEKGKVSPLFNERIEASWSNNIAVFFQGKKLYSKALEYFELALALDRDHGSCTETEDVALDYENIGFLYEEMGNTSRAIEFMKESLRINKLCVGDYSEEVAKNVATLSKLLLKSGEIKKAETYLRFGLDINSNVFGAESKELGEACFLLARVLQVLNQREEGIKLLRKAAELYEKANVQNDPRFADVYVELGQVYLKKKEYKESLESLQEALKLLHSNTVDLDMAGIATVHFIAGNVLKEMGNLGHAISHLHKSLEIRVRVLGQQRIVAHTMSTLGVCYADAYDLERSLNLLKQALELDIKLLGEKHQDVATDYNNVSVLYAELGSVDEALNSIDKCMEIRIELYGKKHPTFGSCLNNKGCIVRALGKIDEAEVLLEEAIQHGVACLGADHIDVALRKNNLAEVIQQKGRFEDAEELYYEVLACWTKKLGELHPRVGLAAANLALLLTDMGKVETAIVYQRQALEINLRSYGPQSGAVARDYNNLGKLLRATLSFEEAEKSIQASIQIRKELLGDDHPYVAISLQNLALLKLRQQKLEEAYMLGKGVHQIFQNKLGEDHPWTKHCWSIWFEKNEVPQIQLDPPSSGRLSTFESFALSEVVSRAATKYTMTFEFEDDEFLTE